jgi:23S rRNA (pseudouridine1915-N3)-methyltransferase
VAGSGPGGRDGTLTRRVVAARAGPERDLVERYLDRLAKAGPGIGLDFAGTSEVPESRARSREERCRDEAALLRTYAGESTLILLDERGRNLSSQDLATLIGKLRDDGGKPAVFAIGGPDGHDQDMRRHAHATIAFGAQTWPHQFVRVMLAEQLYRAVTILSGHPYHRA